MKAILVIAAIGAAVLGASYLRFVAIPNWRVRRVVREANRAREQRERVRAERERARRRN